MVSPEAAAASALARLEGLGAFAALPDALLMRLLSGGDEDDGVGAEALASLCLVSRVFRAFACHEDLWKAEVLRRDGGAFVFRGASWRETYRRGASAAADRARDDGRDDARDDANDSPNIHARHPRIFSDALYSRHLAMHRPLDPAWLEKETIPVMRVPEGVRTEAQTEALASAFVDAYEKKNAPVILRGACADWDAVQNDAWSLPALRKRLTTKNENATFHVGGYEVTLRNWERYCEASRPADEGGFGPVDDAPLYLFDKNFVATAPELFRGKSGKSGKSGVGYEPPEFICSEEDDLFALLPNRPDYRWFIHGPARSGSLFHVDPNGTSAWNAVVRGAKRWILFPPDGLPPPGVHPSADGVSVAQPVTLVEWYASFYEHAYPESETSDSESEEEEESAGERDAEDAPTKTFSKTDTKKRKKGFLSGRRPKYEVLEGTCRAGDVLFVPSGWWHAALNLTETAAVTQNFCSPRTAPRALRFLKRAAALGKGGDASPSLAADLVSGLESRDARGSLYADFLEALRKHRPDVLRAEEVRRVLGEDGLDGEEEKEEKEEDGDGGGTRRRSRRAKKSPSGPDDARKKPRGETSLSRRETTETTRRTNALAGLFAAETRAESKGFAFGF